MTCVVTPLSRVRRLHRRRRHQRTNPHQRADQTRVVRCRRLRSRLQKCRKCLLFLRAAATEVENRVLAVILEGSSVVLQSSLLLRVEGSQVVFLPLVLDLRIPSPLKSDRMIKPTCFLINPTVSTLLIRVLVRIHRVHQFPHRQQQLHVLVIAGKFFLF